MGDRGARRVASAGGFPAMTGNVPAAGTLFQYRVTARRGYAKSRLPGDLFRTDGPPRLDRRRPAPGRFPVPRWCRRVLALRLVPRRPGAGWVCA